MIPIPSIIPTFKNSKVKISEKSSKENIEQDGYFSGSLANSKFELNGNKESSFIDMMEFVAPTNRSNTKEINSLWKELPQLERELIQTRTQDAMEKYKTHVRELLNIIIFKNTIYKKQTTSIPGSIQKKEYTHIEYLDDKLKILAEIISHPQNSAFQILKQMDNIKGFLIDIQS